MTSSVFSAIIIVVFLTDVYIVPKIVGGLKTRSLLAKKPQECTDKELKSMKEEEVNKVLQIMVLRFRARFLPNIADLQVRVGFWCLDFFQKTYNLFNIDLLLALFIYRLTVSPIITVGMLVYCFYFVRPVILFFTQNMSNFLTKIFAKRDLFLAQQMKNKNLLNYFISFYIFRLSIINSIIKWIYELLGKDVCEFLIVFGLILPISFFSQCPPLYGLYIGFLIWLLVYLISIRLRFEFFQKVLLNDPVLETQYLNNLSTIFHPALLVYHRFNKRYSLVELTLNQRRFNWTRILHTSEYLNHTGRAAIFAAAIAIPLGIGCTLYSVHASAVNTEKQCASQEKIAQIDADNSVKTAQINADSSVKTAQIKAEAKIVIAEKNLQAQKDNLAAEKLKQENQLRAQISQDRANMPKATFAADQLEEMKKYEVPKRD